MRPCSSKGRKEECSVFHFLHKFIWIRVGFPAVLPGCVRTAGNFCGWGQGKMQMGTPANAIGDVHFCKKCTSPFFLQSHLFSYFFEAFYDEINIFFCMACAYLCTDSCFSLRNNRIRECNNINTFFHHMLCKFCCSLLVV